MSINIRMLKFAFVGFCLFLFVYAITFSFFPLNSRRILLGILFLAIPFIYKPIIDVVKRKSVIIFFSLCLAYTTYIFIVHVIRGFNDITLLKAMFGFMATSIGGAILFVALLKSLKIDRMSFLRILQVVFLVQSLFIIVSFISPSFKMFVIEFLPYSESSNLSDESFRARGLTNSSGATLSVLQAIGLFITAFLYLTSTKAKYSVYLIVSLCLMIVSLLTVGRTGLLAVVLFPILCQFGFKRNFGFLLFIPVVSILVFTAFRLSYLYLSGGMETEFGVDVFERMIGWVTSEFTNSNGSVQSRTISTLLSSHIVLSDSDSVLIFGDPNLWSGQRRLLGDIGYIRILNSSGIFGFMLFYGMFFYLFARLVRTSDVDKVLYVAMMFFFAITDMKEPFLYNQTINAVLVLLFIYYASSDNILKPKIANPDLRYPR